MIVEELLNFINKKLESDELSLQDEVVVTGEYSYGQSLDYAYVTELAHLNQNEIITEKQNCLDLYISNYLFDEDSIGYTNMYIESTDLDEDLKKYLEECQ